MFLPGKIEEMYLPHNQGNRHWSTNQPNHLAKALFLDQLSRQRSRLTSSAHLDIIPFLFHFLSFLSFSLLHHSVTIALRAFLQACVDRQPAMFNKFIENSTEVMRRLTSHAPHCEINVSVFIEVYKCQLPAFNLKLAIIVLCLFTTNIYLHKRKSEKR